MDAEDVYSGLEAAIGTINGARSLPMSSSCVLNRPELVKTLRRVQERLPEQLAEAAAVVEERDGIVAEGRTEAERIVGRAKRERAVLVSETEVVREARREADALLAKARRDAEEVRRKADDYVDLKLATFEVVLGKTLEAVGRGREKLMGRRPLDELHAGRPAVPAQTGPGEPAAAAARPAAEEAAADAGTPADPEAEADVAGFFDTSVIDVERLRKLHETDG